MFPKNRITCLIALTLIFVLSPLAARAGANEDIVAGYKAYSAKGYGEAQRLFSRALEDGWISAQAKAWAYNGLGQVLISQYQYERAVKEFDNALRSNPDLAEAYMGRGTAYGCLNNYEQSVKDYDQAIRLRPDNPLPYLNRGVTNSKRGYHRNALQDYDRAIALNPNDAQAYARRAFTHKALGNQRECMADAKRARELDRSVSVPPFE